MTDVRNLQWPCTYAQQHARLTKGIEGVLFSTNLWSTCKLHTALEQSFSLSVSTLTDIHESERSIINGKLPSIMFHWYSIHEPHMGDSCLVLVMTGELEVPVKALVGSMITCSGITCSVRSVRHYCIRMYNRNSMLLALLLYMSYKLYAHTPIHINVDTWTQCSSSTVGSQLLHPVVYCNNSCDQGIGTNTVSCASTYMPSKCT